jgi:hypothetical protein
MPHFYLCALGFDHEFMISDQLSLIIRLLIIFAFSALLSHTISYISITKSPFSQFYMFLPSPVKTLLDNQIEGNSMYVIAMFLCNKISSHFSYNRVNEDPRCKVLFGSVSNGKFHWNKSMILQQMQVAL